MTETARAAWPRIPYIGIGCIVVHQARILMVQSQQGLWAPPGGHLDFGETPAACAVRETFEETGVRVRNVEFVGITNDVLEDVDKHYVTIWMNGEPESTETRIGDTTEIAAVGWFRPEELPSPRYQFFENLLAGRSMPEAPANLPPVLAKARIVTSTR